MTVCEGDGTKLDDGRCSSANSSNVNEVQGTRIDLDLEIRFGPIQLFRQTVKYRDVGSAEVGKTMLSEGLGIHFSPRGGWVWNNQS